VRNPQSPAAPAGAAPQGSPPPLTAAALDAHLRAVVRDVAARDPNPLDPYRGLYVSDGQACAAAGGLAGPEIEQAVARVSGCLGLDTVDAGLLWLCVAPELAPEYGRLFGYLQDDAARRLATPVLAARLLPGGPSPARALERFAADAPLRRSHAVRLLEQPPQVPLVERPVKVADRVLSEMIGAPVERRGWECRARRVEPPAYAVGDARAAARLRDALARPSGTAPLVAGADAALIAAAAIGRGLLVIGLEAALDPDTRADATLAAALESRLLCVGGLEEHDADELARALPALLALEAPRLYLTEQQRPDELERWFGMRVEAPPPDGATRGEAWSRLTGRPDSGAVGATFRLSLTQIEAAARTLGTDEDLATAARRVSGVRLGDLGRRLATPHGWEDLILPARAGTLLRSVSGHLRHRDLVLGDWGYGRSVAHTHGLKVLFAGESGTGKTMAAQVLARDLGLDLFRIELAAIVSKYIGETEKNLRRIFGAAERSSAILFFDEADALFGRRSEVRDSHDRYANLEVAYLLQLMEGHPGAVILATNLRQNVDPAFLRRLDFVIEFPLPEAEDRARIWRRMLPDAAPLAGDVDIEFLAERFRLSGGGIRNASLAAAFLAAEDGTAIGMDHLVRAVALEYDKLGRLTLEAEFERFHSLVRH
jgi:hypothetical protein